MNSTELRAILADLEGALSLAADTLAKVESENATAIRESVLSPFGCIAGPMLTEVVLAAARADYARVVASTEAAHALLAESIAREAESAKALARESLTASLSEIDRLAVTGDEALAVLVGCLRQMRAIETEAHRTTRNAFSHPPSMAPRSLSAARPIATFLSTLANGCEPSLKGFVAQAAAEARQNIQAATGE